MSRIEIDIRELVIRGQAVENPAGLAEAVRAELARGLRERGVPAGLRQSGSASRLRARPITAAKTDGRGLGAQVGRAIYGALTR